MGTAVAKGADLALVTSDNPRSEDPKTIIDAILPGLLNEGWQQRKVDQLKSLTHLFIPYVSWR